MAAKDRKLSIIAVRYQPEAVGPDTWQMSETQDSSATGESALGPLARDPGRGRSGLKDRIQSCSMQPERFVSPDQIRPVLRHVANMRSRRVVNEALEPLTLSSRAHAECAGAGPTHPAPLVVLAREPKSFGG